MITTLSRFDIRKVDPHRHKFENAMAEYLYEVALHGMADEQSGSVQWSHWFARIGRWIVRGDEQGFVDCYRSDTLKKAQRAFEGDDREYGFWCGENADAC